MKQYFEMVCGAAFLIGMFFLMVYGLPDQLSAEADMTADRCSQIGIAYIEGGAK